MTVDQSSKAQLACAIIQLGRTREIGRGKTSVIRQVKSLAKWREEQIESHSIEAQLERHLNRVKLQNASRHPNVLTVHKIYVTDDTLYIFQDLPNAGNLFSYFRTKGRLLEAEAAVMVYQLAAALNSLHTRDIFHRAINPTHVYVLTSASGCRVMLGGFDRAQQVLLDHALGHDDRFSGLRKDTWSLGVITIYLITASIVLDQEHLYNYDPTSMALCDLHRIQNSDVWNSLSAEVQDFTQYLLRQRESLSIFPGQLLEHKWFSGQKDSLEAQYAKITANWRPSVTDIHQVEFIRDRSHEVRNYPCAKAIIKEQRERESGLRSPHKPINPPYLPYPRSMYIPLMPKASMYPTWSPQVNRAITKHWQLLSEFSQQEKSPAVSTDTKLATGVETASDLTVDRKMCRDQSTRRTVPQQNRGPTLLRSNATEGIYKEQLDRGEPESDKTQQEYKQVTRSEPARPSTVSTSLQTLSPSLAQDPTLPRTQEHTISTPRCDSCTTFVIERSARPTERSPFPPTARQSNVTVTTTSTARTRPPSRLRTKSCQHTKPLTPVKRGQDSIYDLDLDLDLNSDHDISLPPLPSHPPTLARLRRRCRRRHEPDNKEVHPHSPNIALTQNEQDQHNRKPYTVSATKTGNN